MCGGRGVRGAPRGCEGSRGGGGGVLVVPGVAIFVFSPQLPSREGATLEPLLCVTNERENY